MPRLSIYRSLHHIYAQVISDDSGKTLAAASTQTPELRDGLRASAMWTRRKRSARRSPKCLASGITHVIFDRNGFLYHGRLKALADGAREAGLKF